MVDILRKSVVQLLRWSWMIWMGLYADGVSLHGLSPSMGGRVTKIGGLMVEVLLPDQHENIGNCPRMFIYCMTKSRIVLKHYPSNNIIHEIPSILSIKSYEFPKILPFWPETPRVTCVTLAGSARMTSGGYRARAAIPEDIERRGHFLQKNWDVLMCCWMLADLLGSCGAELGVHLHSLHRLSPSCAGNCWCQADGPAGCWWQCDHLISRVYCCDDCPSPNTASASIGHWNCPPRISRGSGRWCCNLTFQHGLRKAGGTASAT